MRLLYFLFFLIYSLNSFSQKIKTDVDIDLLVKSMSVEEKAGQMTQIDLGVIAEGEICNLKNPQAINLEKLRNAISVYKIGSILNVGCGSGTISRENWSKILTSIKEENTRLNRLKIPIIYGVDAIHGANYTIGATLFPQPIGQAATWNPELVEKVYDITAYETRASGIPWNFSPVLDLGRQPLWSRFFETFGEDVYLAKSMSKVAIRGLEGTDSKSPYKVASCMKHFLGYSMPLSGKDRSPAWISERELREYFLPTFQEAIKQGSKTIMINSGEINGTPVHIDYDILTTLLRKELGFKGVILTDWEDIYKLVSAHRVAANKKEAVKMSIMAGIDMSMTPNDFDFTKLLVELIKEGTIPMSRIDESVSRILQLKKDLGLFNELEINKETYAKFGSKEYSNISYQVAAESITLLKNKNSILPLRNNKENILICGPAASSLNLLNGAWTHTWQGIDTKYNTVGKVTILEAIKNNTSNKQIDYSLGASLDSLYDLELCIEKARKADKIIICIGETPSTEIVGNIKNLSLSASQRILITKLSELKKPIILICAFNRPRILNEFVDKVDAILYSYLPGDEGGIAISDCLFGKINPSGKLPFTYPADVNDIIHYDHKRSEDMDVDFSMNAYRPQFDFGFGLSYTQFEYSNFKISSSTITENDSLKIYVTIKNIGSVIGKETVQVYYADLYATITPSVKKLVRFSKIELKPNESKEVVFIIHSNDLSFINKKLDRVTEKGEFEIIINNQKKTFYVN